MILAVPAHAQDAAPAEPAATAADDGYGEILVTARRREESQQTVPVAVSVISADQIARRANFDPLDLGKLAPGLNGNTNSANKSLYYFSIRGQSYTSGTLYGAVVPYVAEAPHIRLTQGQFFDIGNIQVLRGPQGTLFGRVTNGGAILIEPQAPKPEFGGYFTQQYGSYDLHTTAGAINVPVVEDVLAVRAAFERGRQNGYVRNLSGGPRLMNTNYDSFRVSALLTPFEGFKNLTIFNYNKSDETGVDSRMYLVNRTAFVSFYSRYYGAAGAAALADQAEAQSREQVARSARVTRLTPGADLYDKHKGTYLVNKTDLEVLPEITLRNILSYQTYWERNASDYDGVLLDLQRASAPFLPTANNNREYFTNEFQVQASLLDKKLEVTAGVYYDDNKPKGRSETIGIQVSGLLITSYTQQVRAKSLAFYGQATYDLDDVLPGVKINGGIRRTTDKTSGSGFTYGTSGDPSDPAVLDRLPHGLCIDSTAGYPGVQIFAKCLAAASKISSTTYMVGLDWQITPQTLVYVKQSRGYRPGGFNSIPVDEGADLIVYDPEFNLSRELGVKSDWSIGGVKVRTNISAFYDQKSGVQVRGALVSPTTGVQYAAVLNMDQQDIYGLEFEGNIRPGGGIVISARYAYSRFKNILDSYSADYLAAACPADPYTMMAVATKPCPLNKVARLPRHALGVEVRHSSSLGELGELDLGFNYEYTSGQYMIDGNYVNPDTYRPKLSLFNADARISDVMGAPVDLSVFVNNLFDKKYWAYRGSTTQLGGSGYGQAAYGTPRMIGAAIKVRFGS